MAERQPRRPRPGRNRFERFIFIFMGPADRGDLHAPIRELPARPVHRCAKCRLPYDDHEVVRDPGLTHMRCPPVSGQSG